MSDKQIQPVSDEVLTIDEKVLGRITQLLEKATGSASAGVDKLIERVLTMEAPEDVNAIVQTDKMADYLGQALRVEAITPLPSDYEGGLPFYLGVDATELETGEKIHTSVGGMVPALALLTFAANGWLPATVVVRKGERKTRRGFYPWNIEYVPTPRVS